MTAVGFYPVYRLQAAGADYTPQELNTSLEAALKAREALLKQLTNTRPPGMLEDATAKGAPADLIQVLNAAITAVRAEVAILKRCTETFPLSDDAAAKCLTDLQASSKKIADAIDAAAAKLQEKITRLEGLGLFELGVYGREKRDRDLALLRPILMVAQTQKAAVTAAIVQWQRYAQGNMVRPPMPMPPPPVTPMPVPPPMDPPSPFAPVPDPDEDPPVTPPRPPITFTPPRPPVVIDPNTPICTFPCPRPPRPPVTTPPPTNTGNPPPRPTNPVTPPRPTNPPPRPPRPVTIYVPTYQPGTSNITGYEERSMDNLPTLPAGWTYRFETRGDGRTYAVPVRTTPPVAPPRPYVPLEALPSYR